MKSAVIYARYSSDSQSEQSIEGQLRVCNEYARNNDILIVATYIDRAMTGKNDNRPDFQRMLKDSARKQWDYVLVYKLDRFSRNKYETAVHKHTLKINGVRVISATEFVPDTPEGIILESMLEGYAEYYSAELSQKINRGLRESRLKGQFCGGKLPYGYRVENKKIFVDDLEAKTVHYIFERYSIGVVVPQIIVELNEKGLLHRGTPFRQGNIYKILENEKYAGIYRAKDGEVFKNMYPRIIEQELFERVKKKCDRNKCNHHSTKVVYLLKNKLKCGYCGRPVTADVANKNGKTFYYYKCSTRKRRIENCTLETIRKDVLENAVLDHITKTLSSPKMIPQIVDALDKIQEQYINEMNSIKVLKDQKQKIDLALQNVMSAIERGIVSNTTNKRLHELEDEQAEIERKIILEQAKTVERVPREEIAAWYKQTLKLEPHLLINYLVKEIKLYNDCIEIIYNAPIQFSPDESQGFSFYREEIQLEKYNAVIGVFEYKEVSIVSKI